MAFQLTGPQVIEHLKKIFAVRDEVPGMTLGEWIELCTEDQKEKDRLYAAFIVADKVQKSGRDLLRVSKVIAWRDDKGKPSDLQIEFRR